MTPDRPVIVRALPEHCVALAERLREKDLAEIGVGERSPERSILRALDAAECAFTWLHEGAPAAMFGLSPLQGKPYFWLYTSRVVDEYPFRVARHAYRILHRLLDVYPTIGTWINAADASRVKWMQFLGFERITERHVPIGDQRGLHAAYYEITR